MCGFEEVFLLCLLFLSDMTSLSCLKLCSWSCREGKSGFKVVSALSSASVDSPWYQHVEQLILQHNKAEV